MDRRLVEQRLYIVCQESGRLRYWVREEEEMRAHSVFHCPCIYFCLPISPAVPACDLQSSKRLADVPNCASAGSGNHNVTVTPETMQAICKGSRDDFVNCCRLHVSVDRSNGLGGCIIVVVASLAWYFLISAASTSTSIKMLLLSCLITVDCRNAETAQRHAAS